MGFTADQTQLKNELVYRKIGEEIFRLAKMEEMCLQKTQTKVNAKGYCSLSKRKNSPCWKTGRARRNIQQQKDRRVNKLK